MRTGIMTDHAISIALSAYEMRELELLATHRGVAPAELLKNLALARLHTERGWQRQREIEDGGRPSRNRPPAKPVGI